MERVCGDREPALRVDQVDGLQRREPRRDPLLQPEPDHVAVEAGDLLADNDVDPRQLRMAEGEVTRAQRAVDVVVIGQRDDVASPGGGTYDRLGRLGAVATVGVNVEVEPARGQDPTRPRAERGTGTLGRKAAS